MTNVECPISNTEPATTSRPCLADRPLLPFISHSTLDIRHFKPETPEITE